MRRRHLLAITSFWVPDLGCDQRAGGPARLLPPVRTGTPQVRCRVASNPDESNFEQQIDKRAIQASERPQQRGRTQRHFDAASTRLCGRLPELTYSFHDRDMLVTACGRTLRQWRG